MAYETLKIGYTSEDVLKMKQLLKALEYRITSVDPTFDYQTKTSLEAFQNDMGIPTQNMNKTMQKLESFYRQRFPKDEHHLFTAQQATVQNIPPSITPIEESPLETASTQSTPVNVEATDVTPTMKTNIEEIPNMSEPEILSTISSIPTTETPHHPQRQNSLASIEEIDVGIRFDGPPSVQTFFEQSPSTDDFSTEATFVHSSACCYNDYLESCLFNDSDLIPEENQPMIASFKKREHIPFENNTNMNSTERLVTAIEKKYANMHFTSKNRCPDL